MKKVDMDLLNIGAAIVVVFVLWTLLSILLSGYREISSAYNVIFLLIASFAVSYFFSGSNKK